MWFRVKNSIVANLVLLLIAVFASYGAFNLARYGWELKKEWQEAQKKILEFAKKKKELEKYRAELETMEVAEKMAKGRFNLKLPGEKVVIVIPQTSSTNTEGPRQFSGFKGVWIQVKYFFTRLWASFVF